MEARQAGQRFRASWYESRAKGQLQRFDQVRDCGAKELVLNCEQCGHESRRITAWCRHWRLCIGCRSRRGQQYRKRFRHSRQLALRRLAPLLHGSPAGGAWSEKLLTLTLPHSGDVRHDVATLPKAWRAFWRLLREHLEQDRGLSKFTASQLVYLRVIEITMGRKGDGHAHMHVYLICPYLHHEVLGLLWARAIGRYGYDLNARRRPIPLGDVIDQVMTEWRRDQLRDFLVTRRNGKPLELVPNPHDDVRQCYDGIEIELIKYLIKDAERDQDGRLVFDDGFLARVYEGTEGIRMVQTSRRFLVPADGSPCTCQRCGSDRLHRKIEKAKEIVVTDPIWSVMSLPPGKWKDPK